MIIPKIHKLKVLLKYYPDIENELKPFELRKNDRYFQANDYLLLIPYDKEKQEEMSDCRKIAKITYVLKDAKEFGLMEGYAILGLKFWACFSTEERLIYRLILAQ